MKAIFIEPGKAPRTLFIPNELGVLQQLVDGYIETLTVASDLVIVCDEEGRLKGKPYNCTFLGVDFVGPILLCGVNGEEFTDVPDGWELVIEACGVNRGRAS